MKKRKRTAWKTDFSTNPLTSRATSLLLRAHMAEEPGTNSSVNTIISQAQHRWDKGGSELYELCQQDVGHYCSNGYQDYAEKWGLPSGFPF